MPDPNVSAGNGPAVSADNRSVLGANPDQGSNGIGETLLAGLSKENRSTVEAKQWLADDGKTPDLNKVLDGYRNSESYAKQTLKPPGEDATADEWNAFYSKLGRPEKPEGYEFPLPDGLPEDFPYDETSAVEYRNWAHEAGLTPRQAKFIHDKFVGKSAGQFSTMHEQVKKAEADTHRALRSKWGDPDTDVYRQNVEFADRVLRNSNGLKADLIKFGMLDKDGGIRSASLAEHLASTGKARYAEDNFATNPSGVLRNPFSEGEHFNLTEAGKLVRSDPAKARALIVAAGKNPVDFGM